MIAADYTSIQKHLKSNNIQAELQKENNQLCIVLEAGGRSYPLFIRIMEGGDLLQLLTFLPCNTKDDTVADTARLLHLLNKELELPGFGMEERHHLLFYRSLMPIKDNKIDKLIFNAYLNATQTIGQAFLPVIAAVAYGSLTFAEVLKNAEGQNLTEAYFNKNV